MQIYIYVTPDIVSQNGWDYIPFATFAATIMLKYVTGLLNMVSGAQDCLEKYVCATVQNF